MKLWCCKDDVGFMSETLAGTWKGSTDKARLNSGMTLPELKEIGVDCVRVELKEIKDS